MRPLIPLIFLIPAIIFHQSPSIQKIKFKAPVIADKLIGPVDLTKTDSMSISRYYIGNVRPFGDTCNIHEFKKSFFYGDVFIDKQEKTDSLIVYVDTMQLIMVENKIFNPQKGQSYSGYPCFVANENAEKRLLRFQHYVVTVIQEALTPDSCWSPIQIFSHADCGNSYGKIIIKPDHYLFFMVPVYNGEFYTDLRLRFMDQFGNVFFSNIYKGRINPKQFEIPESYYSNYSAGRFLRPFTSFLERQ